jgi:general secretion pathway protein H
MSMSPAITDTNPLRIVFGREPVDKPFVLTMTVGDASVALRADGIGHFVVE